MESMSNEVPTLKEITNNARIGKRLRELRMSKGLKMKWVGNQIGISESHVSLMERGLRSWPPGMESRYLKAIGEL